MAHLVYVVEASERRRGSASNAQFHMIAVEEAKAACTYGRGAYHHHHPVFPAGRSRAGG